MCNSPTLTSTDSAGIWWTITSGSDPLKSSGPSPTEYVRQACGSRSTSRTRWPRSASAAPSEWTVVVFATPPFWLAMASTLGTRASLLTGRQSAMDGIHDLGGVEGFGPVEARPDEPVFAEDWERRAFRVNMAVMLAVEPGGG